MSRCPECNGPLAVPTSFHTLDRNGNRVAVTPSGAWCRTNPLCDYGAISIDQPDVPHPALANLRFQRSQTEAFQSYVERLALAIPEVEIDPARCGGRPVFTQSRLPLAIIVSLIVQKEDDEAILSGYPRLTLFLLNMIKQAVAAAPPPRVEET